MPPTKPEEPEVTPDDTEDDSLEVTSDDTKDDTASDTPGDDDQADVEPTEEERADEAEAHGRLVAALEVELEFVKQRYPDDSEIHKGVKAELAAAKKLRPR